MRPGPIRVGHDFGARYHVQKLLGSGGMGVVYQALDHALGVEIALKVLRAPAVGAKSARSLIEMQQRLRTELVLARQITHKHVIRIHDIGDVNGIRFISMPLVKGPDLAAVLKGGRLPAARAVRYARQIAAGLMAVHAAGVVHRDIKPGNIMIDTGDQAVLMDFGIARSSASDTPQRTAAGAVIGTPAYMAPEQARGESVDPRTDVYAFGLVLYEMLTGPRADVSMGELAARMKAPPPPAQRLNPRVPAALEAIATRCLQPAREDRYQTSAELAAALAGLGRRASRDTKAAPGPWVTRAAAMLVIAALAGAGYWLAAREGARLLASGGSMVRRSIGVLNPAPLFARERAAALDRTVDRAPKPVPLAAALTFVDAPVRRARAVLRPPPEAFLLRASTPEFPRWTGRWSFALGSLFGFGSGALEGPRDREEFPACFAPKAVQ